MPVEASFRTLAARVEAELRERGSRFLAIAVPVSGRDEAEAFLSAQARAHRDPTHVVPAFHLRDGTAYSSDAGEPAGSAGVPLLHAIEGAGLTDVAAVVVRWYGGTKLGVGGLVRAYGGALAAALDGAPTRACVRAQRVRVLYAHERTAPVMRAVQSHGGRDVAYGYEADAASVTLLLPEREVDRFAVALRDATQGAVVPELLGAAVIRLPAGRPPDG
jgi:putative IMPACT (imprinted ancient) family translation regulator